MPSGLISARAFACVSLDAVMPREADQAYIKYGFPVLSASIGISFEAVQST